MPETAVSNCGWDSLPGPPQAKLPLSMSSEASLYGPLPGFFCFSTMGPSLPSRPKEVNDCPA